MSDLEIALLPIRKLLLGYIWPSLLQFVDMQSSPRGLYYKKSPKFITTAQNGSLYDHLFKHPIMDVRTAEKLLGVIYATANNALSNLETAGFVVETTGRKRNRMFRFQGYLQLFDDTPSKAPAIYDSEKPTGYQHGTDEPVEEEPPRP